MKEQVKENFNKSVKEIAVKAGEQPKVKVTETYEEPRYVGKILADMEGFYGTQYIEGIKEDCKIWVGAREYDSLTNYKVDTEEFTGDLSDDLETFQGMLDQEFGKGKYEAFILGAYIHSSTAFSVNKTGNNICQWDSGQLGFIGLPTDSDSYHQYTSANPDAVATDLTAAWNGDITEYQIIDNLTGDIEDSIVVSKWSQAKHFAERAKDNYGIDFFNMKVTY